MHFLHTFLLGTAITAAAAKHVLHEKRGIGEAHLWQKRERAHGKMPLGTVRILLQEENLHRAEEFLMSVSDPSSSNYGQHWSAEKVANTFLPSAATRNKVLAWLQDEGINRNRITFSPGHNEIRFDGTVEEMERLLATEYHIHAHDDGGYRLASEHYSIPSHLKPHVNMIMPTIQLEGLQPLKAGPQINLQTSLTGGDLGTYGCMTLTTIECLRRLYNFKAATTSVPGNNLGISEWSDFLYEPDLPIFFKNFTSPRIPSDTVPVFYSIDGGLTANASTVAMGSGVEAALDVQTAYSIIWPQQINYYQIGDSVNSDSVGTFNIMLDALDEAYCTYLGGDSPYVDPAVPDPSPEGGYKGELQCGTLSDAKHGRSSVISVSYGQIEAALPKNYQVRQCNEYLKLSLQGISVIFASGDSGVANRYNAGYPDSCVNSAGLVDANGTIFSPSFPANCPYVTAVGATVVRSNNTKDGEQASTSFGSGGGFSNVFAAPSYQAKEVRSYLDHHAPNYGHGVYNNSGKARGFPDVAAIGQHGPVIFNGKLIGVGGTSLSAPIFASLINTINGERISRGKKTLGFLNPFLYANPSAFNDITIGNNSGCGTPGFYAAKGWDPVTGLGTPNYGKLLEAALKLK